MFFPKSPKNFRLIEKTLPTLEHSFLHDITWITRMLQPACSLHSDGNVTMTQLLHVLPRGFWRFFKFSVSIFCLNGHRFFEGHAISAHGQNNLPGGHSAFNVMCTSKQRQVVYGGTQTDRPQGEPAENQTRCSVRRLPHVSRHAQGSHRRRVRPPPYLFLISLRLIVD